jgi:hypothetical protein
MSEECLLALHGVDVLKESEELRLVLKEIERLEAALQYTKAALQYNRAEQTELQGKVDVLRELRGF